MVFLHGAGVDNRLWDPQVAAFEQTHRVIVPNLPGHGGVPAVTDVTQMADHVRAVLKDLGITRYAVVGLSLGGMVALDMAGRWPEEVTHLAMIESVPIVTDHPALRAFGKLVIGMFRFVPPKLLAKLPARQMGAESTDAARYLKQALSKGTAHNTYQVLRAALAYDGRAYLPMIQMPTMVLVGERNKATHARAQGMCDVIVHSEFFVVPAAGHIANLDAPEFVTTRLKVLLT